MSGLIPIQTACISATEVSGSWAAHPLARSHGHYNYNSSARFYQITDITGTYNPVYNSDSPIPHLTSITGTLGTFTPQYLSNSTLSPPFGTVPNYAGATTTLLSSLAVPGGPQPYGFTCDSASAGELLKVIFPAGGNIGWSYVSFPRVKHTGNWAFSERMASGSKRKNAGSGTTGAVNSASEGSAWGGSFVRASTP